MVMLIAPFLFCACLYPTVCLLSVWQFLPRLFREPKQSTVVQMSSQSIKRLFSIPSLITPNDFFLELSVMTCECFALEVTASSGHICTREHTKLSLVDEQQPHPIFGGFFMIVTTSLSSQEKSIIDKFCRFFNFIPSFQLSIICLKAVSCIQDAGHYFLQMITEKLLTSCHKTLTLKCTPVHDDIVAVLCFTAPHWCQNLSCHHYPLPPSTTPTQIFTPYSKVPVLLK